MIKKIKQLWAEFKARRPYNECYARMEKIGYGVFSMCGGVLVEDNGVKTVATKCLDCPHFVDVPIKFGF